MDIHRGLRRGRKKRMVRNCTPFHSNIISYGRLLASVPPTIRSGKRLVKVRWNGEAAATATKAKRIITFMVVANSW